MIGNSLAVQGLELRISTAGGLSSIPDQGIKILHVMQCDQEIQK